MILPYILQVTFALIGLAVSVIAVLGICYIAFELLGDLFKEEDNG